MATLPRSPLLGVELHDPPFSARGMHVRAVRPGSTAAEAGVVAGDVIVGIGGLPVRAAAELRRALAAIDEDRVALETERGLLEGPVRRRPVEVVPGAEVVLGHLERDGVRLRTILTRPPTPGPAVLFLQGIVPSSLDFGAAAGSPVARLVHGLAAAGLFTLRLERRGVGDSEGELPDFDTEVADAAAALAWLAAEPGVQGVVLFGHSVGGMVAPRLAHPALVGRVVLGTTARSWGETLAAGTRRQLALRGLAEPAIEAAVVEEARALRDDAVIHGRARAFHDQLAATDLRAAWRSCAATGVATRVLIGEHDWVVGEDEQREVAALAGGEARLLAGLDHAFTTHAGRAESLRDYGRGAFCEALVDEVAAFVREVTRGAASR